MRNVIDPNQACTGLVQNYIGSAYDVVKAVYDQLDAIKTISDSLQNDDFQKIVDMADDIGTLTDLMEDCNNRYYGPSETVPTSRPDGTPSQSGDMYFDIPTSLMNYYREGNWAVIGEEFSYLQVFSISEEDITSAGVTLELDQPYAPNSNNLMVFVNSTYQYAVTANREGGAYDEVDENTIRFPTNSLEEGDIVAVINGDVISSANFNVGIETQTHITNVEGEKFITLPGEMTYTPGDNNLEIFVNGIRQTNNLDYTETSSTTVTFNGGLNIGDTVLFKKGNLVGSGDNGLVDKFQVLNIADDFYSLYTSLNNALPIFLEGYNLPNDGGAGIFLYDASAPRISANGGTWIDASVDRYSQGSGTGNGCWIRQYSHGISGRWYGKEATLAKDIYTIGHGNENDYLVTQGYREIDDNGENTYLWDAECPKTAHDGGSIIDPGKGFPSNWNDEHQMRGWYTPAVSGSGCWVCKDLTQLNINHYGANGDGITDNSLVFEGLAQSVNAQIIKRIKVPVGNYTFLTPYIFEIKDRDVLMEFYGEGKTSILSFAENASPKSMYFNKCSNVSFHNIAFHENRLIPCTALSFEDSSNIIVKECYFENWLGTCIYIGDNPYLGTAAACDNVHIIGNEFENCTSATTSVIEFSPKEISTDSVISENTFLSCGSVSGANIGVTSGASGITIKDNTLISPAGVGIKVSAYESAIIRDNTVTEGTNAGIQINVSSVADYPSPQLKSLLCQQNIINDTSAHGIEVLGDLDISDFIEISDNILIRSGGITVAPEADLPKMSIIFNRIESMLANLYGVEVSNVNGGTVVSPTITKNYFVNEETRALPIITVTDGTNVTIHDNLLMDADASDIATVNCTNTEVTDNSFIRF